MQINLENYSFFIKPKFIDMRKGARTLAYIVQDEMGLKPFEKSVFVFCGKTKRIIKAIVWDENGWIEIIKRLESPGTFRWPESEHEALSVSADELLATLKGHDIWRRLPVLNPRLVG
jgi:transposase